MSKNFIIAVLVILVLGLGAYTVWLKEEANSSTTSQEMGVYDEAAQAEEYAKDHPYGDGGPVADDSMNVPDGGSIQYYPNEYFLIPEFRIGFRKHPQLDLTYTVKGNELIFTSNGLKEVAKYDPNITYCVSGFTPYLSISSTKEDTIGGGQIALADGRYLNYVGQQEPCYNPSKTTDSSAQKVRDQAGFFSVFLKSVQSY